MVSSRVEIFKNDQQSKIPILLIDTDLSEGKWFKSALEDLSPKYSVDHFENDDSILEQLTKKNYQFIFIEAFSSAYDSFSIIERVKRVSAETVVFLFGKSPSVPEVVKSMQLGASNFFERPLNIEKIKGELLLLSGAEETSPDPGSFAATMSLITTCQVISSSFSEDKILDTVVAHLRRETGCIAVGLFKKNKKKFEHYFVPSEFDVDVLNVILSGNRLFEIMKDDKLTFFSIPKTVSTPEIIAFDVTVDSSEEVYLVGLSPSWPNPTAEVESRYRVLQAQLKLASKNIKNFKDVKEQLYIDEVTGLYNARYLHYTLDRLLEKKRGKSKGFAVLFIDVDKFKSVNDTHGHMIGTKVLVEIGEIIKKNLRTRDVALRYGGDEFVVVLDLVTSKDAAEIAERLRSQVESFDFCKSDNIDLSITISVGVAGYPEHAKSKREIIESADLAMYSAKRSTRNRVIIAEKKAA